MKPTYEQLVDALADAAAEAEGYWASEFYFPGKKTPKEFAEWDALVREARA